jgi:23S rRNA (uracil1939-C5)-methyltransferase
LIGRAYGEQLQFKRERVVQSLRAYPRLAALDVPEVVGSSRAFGYRNQAKLVVRRARRGVLLGVYRPGTHQVADVRRCAAHDPLIEPVLAAVADVIEKADIPVYDERDQSGCLRYVVVRVAVWNHTAQVILVTKTKVLPQSRQIQRALERVRGVVSIVQNVNADPGNVILGPVFVPLTKEASLIDKVGPFKLRTRPGAFLQANHRRSAQNLPADDGMDRTGGRRSRRRSLLRCRRADVSSGDDGETRSRRRGVAGGGGRRQSQRSSQWHQQRAVSLG